MSRLEDWYPLAAKDLQTSSDEDLPATTSPFVAGSSSSNCSMSTPMIRDLVRPQSPTSEAIEATLAGLGPMRADPESSSDGETVTSSTRIGFGDPLDVPDSSVTAQERWQRTDAYMRDVQSAFRTRPAVRVQSNERYMKFLLVGEPGLGKDLFTKNMFASYCADNDLPVNSCTAETDPRAFLHNSTEFCTEVVVDVDEGRTKIHYMIQDTPGTHLVGAERSILKHVMRQNQEYMAKEEDPRRVVPLSTLPDPRVDICLYFLSPHFLKPQDVSLMTKLSEFVPVIPIISRADALTTEELERYRHEIREKLQNVSLQVGRPVMHNFSAADLKAAGAVREVPPFAIITSNEIDHEVGSHWFMRTFPWGRCEVMSSNHSDLPALKALLFECCFEGLKAATESRFYSAREAHLTTRALSRALSSGELPSNLPKPRGSETLKTSAFTRAPKPASSAPSKSPPPRSSPESKSKASTQGWRISTGMAVGVVTTAILLQLIALGIYARNTNQLKALVESYQDESTAEKQVLYDVKELLIRQQEVLSHAMNWLPPASSDFVERRSFIEVLKLRIFSAAYDCKKMGQKLFEALARLFGRQVPKGSAHATPEGFRSGLEEWGGFEEFGDSEELAGRGLGSSRASEGTMRAAAAVKRSGGRAAGQILAWGDRVRVSAVAAARRSLENAQKLSRRGVFQPYVLRNHDVSINSSTSLDLGRSLKGFGISDTLQRVGTASATAWQKVQSKSRFVIGSWSFETRMERLKRKAARAIHRLSGRVSVVTKGFRGGSRAAAQKLFQGYQKLSEKVVGYFGGKLWRPPSKSRRVTRWLTRAIAGGFLI